MRFISINSNHNNLRCTTGTFFVGERIVVSLVLFFCSILLLFDRFHCISCFNIVERATSRPSGCALHLQHHHCRQNDNNRQQHESRSSFTEYNNMIQRQHTVSVGGGISSKQTTQCKRIRSSMVLYSSNENADVDKGFNILELASSIVPQGQVVTVVSESWKFIWKRMMTELAPQDKTTGAYVRPQYDNVFTGVIGESVARIDSIYYPDEPGRYHLYTGNPCPWCHRVVLTLKLLQYTVPDQIGWTVLEDNPKQASRGGWIFSKQQPDTIFGGCQDLQELYSYLYPNYTGRCTAPLLVDTKTKTIVSNDSANIIRMLNQNQFRNENSESIQKKKLNLVPNELVNHINDTNEWIYKQINNGVYQCGFATTQNAYNSAAQNVQSGLQRCDTILSKSNYLCSHEYLTESDIFLLPTIIRYDCVYQRLFKAPGMIRSDYPHIYAWLQRLWNQYPDEIQTSIDIEDACSSYYKQLFPLNPSGIIPAFMNAEAIGLK